MNKQNDPGEISEAQVNFQATGVLAWVPPLNPEP